MNFIQIFLEILVLVIYIGIGYFAKKKQFITEAGSRDMSKIVVNIAMPLLVISSMNIAYDPRYLRNMLIMAVLSLVYFFFSSLATKKLSSFYADGRGNHRELRYCMIFGNAVFLGYPLSLALFGSEGVLYASVYVAIQNIFQWTVGVQNYATSQSASERLKHLINPGLIAILIGLILFFFRIETPAYFLKIAKGIGAISVPLALMVVGSQLDLGHMREALRNRGIMLSVFTKCLVFPAIFLTLLMLTPIDSTLKSILTIEIAAPVQASAALFARNFGGDVLTAAKCVALSTSIAILSIPFFLIMIA
ncbi:MAG: malate permease [Clostridiales bacterium]|jgi:predicted permease|nr:malate permease [Clostridiales bacterium]